MSQKIVLIWAESRNGVIGDMNTIPWTVPEDLQQFRNFTVGEAVIMGRKTYESLPQQPLPSRRCVVITRQENYQAEGAEVVNSLEEAIELTKDQDQTVFIAGGAEVYHDALPIATHAIVTEIDIDVNGDDFAPTLDENWTQYLQNPDSGWYASKSGILYRTRFFSQD